MRDKHEVEAALNEKLEAVRREKDEVSKDIEAVKEKRDSTDIMEDWNAFEKAEKKLKDGLDEAGKKLLQKRDGLKKKMRLCGFVTVIVGILYVLFAISAIEGAIEPSSTGESVLLYIAAAVAGVLLYKVSLGLLVGSYKRKHKEISEAPAMIEFDKKSDELYKQLLRNKRSTEKTLEDLKNQQSELKRRLNEIINLENELVTEIQDIEFNYEYNGSIFFWGKQRNNRYEIYLDGVHYDTVRGHDIIRIRLTPGLHSFKIQNTCYSDGEIVYCYDFNTWQLSSSDEEARAYALVCDFKEAKFVSCAEFEKVTKTKFI